MFSSLAAWLEHHMTSCFFKEQFGLICPGCGSQRAFILMLKGEWWASVLQYPPLLPFIATLVFLCLHLYFKFTKGGTWLKYMFIFTAGLVVVNFVVKLCLHHE